MLNTGLEFLGHASPGTHYCQFYHGPDDLLESTLSFLEAGWEKGDYCVWIVPSLLTNHPRIASRTREAAASGRLEMITETEWYGERSSLLSQEIFIQKVAAKIEELERKGHHGFRGVGGMHRVPRSLWKDVIAYEHTLQDFLQKKSMLTLCTYSLIHCPIQNIPKLIAEHDHAFLKKGIHWEVVSA